MSLATWKKEFYPIPASRCPEKDALQHSLRKYLGVRPTMLNRHNLFKAGCTLCEYESQAHFHFIERTCALCKFYTSKHKCNPQCPLARKEGPLCGDEDSAYMHWHRTGDPEPMIRALRRAVKKQERKGA